MIKRMTLLLLVLLLSGIYALAQTSLQGKVVDDSGEPVLFGNVIVYQNGVQKTGTQTDFDGNYSIGNIDPGTYDVEVRYVGLQTTKIEGVLVKANQSNVLDFTLTSGVLMEEVVVVEYKAPLIDKDKMNSGGIVTAEKIKNLPIKDVNSLASTTAGLSSVDGGNISIRGSRTNQTNYYIDGVRVSGRMIPQSEIEQLQVLTGGISARYGDVTGGIISITTKGPSSRFTGGVELETSEFLDAFGYNLVSANFSGPILKNADGKSIIGFRVAGQYRLLRDDDPSAVGFYAATEERIKELEENPVFLLSGSPVSTAERLSEGNGVEKLDARPNTEQIDLDLNGKLDFRLSDNIDLTLSGTYQSAYDRFMPDPINSSNVNEEFVGTGAWGLLNWENNPVENRDIYRGNVRFRHRLGSSYRDAAATDEEVAGSATSLIKNLAYTIQLGYEKRYTTREDYRHKDNLFDYGYVGRYDVTWDTTYRDSIDEFGNVFQLHTGYRETLNGYEGSDVNKALAAYNNNFEEVPDFITNYLAYNGTSSNIANTVWGGNHLNVGGVFNRFRKEENDRLSGEVNISFELQPGASESGKHSIELGVLYEQRVNRVYEVRPFSLWTLARLYANQHIGGLDFSNYDSLTNTFANSYDPGLLTRPGDQKFFRSVRELKYPGRSIDETIGDFINVDDIDPSQLSLDMFSGRELADRSVVAYYGYDYLGNRSDVTTTFEDFFKTDANGQRSFNVAPDQPIYGAIYLQDRFTLNDLIFRFGIRADYYDANSKVLKDKYSLYTIMGADQFHNSFGTERPDGIGSDFKVYVTEEDGESVKAYRDGDTWYDASGTEVPGGGRLIFGQGGRVFPKYQYDEDEVDPQSENFNPSLAFEDYKPQWNVMPRLGFSFPISDEAAFFAHYDILVSRPLSRNIASSLSYFYWGEAGRTPSNNPNLKPVKTIDYEVGFQQRLTNSSALKLSAYYKEYRDLIQARTLLFTSPDPINNFLTFDNIDFGTTKGFSIQYDLRRTGNIELTAAYTLQFAEGTGSDDDSQRSLTNNGRNVRTLSPLSFDERHRIVATVDYRYGSGKKYNGPRWFGKDVFSNAGVNFQFTTVSGRPFTKRQTPTRFGGTGLNGSLNGARKPWSFTVDMRIDKDFRVNSPEAARPLFINVYFRVRNLLNTLNVVDVYTATGSPDDDGYLNSSFGENTLNDFELNGRGDDLDFYVESYNWRLLNPDNYARPRRMYVGVIFDF